MTYQRRAGHAPDPQRWLGPAVVVGSALEWFDFFLYASMAALVFGPVFFPDSQTSVAGTLAAVATFAVGFVARPFGGIVFGVLGDKFGRKRALSWSFLLMGVASGLIGLIPSYAAIGLAAPAILVGLRILQGLGAGAEFGPAVAVSYEHADAGSRGRMGAWPAIGVNIGLLASSLTVAALTSMDGDVVREWGWRLAFLGSLILVAVGFWVRSKMPDSPEFERVKLRQRTSGALAPLVALVRSDWRGLAVVMTITVGYLSASYIFKTFTLSYLSEFRGVAANIGAFGITLASACAVMMVPIAGRMCDRFGSAKVMLAGAAGTAALAFPLFWMLNTATPAYIWLGLVLAIGIVIPMMLGATGSFFARQFPAQVRVTGMGTGREIGGMAGGLAPFTALAIVAASPGHASWGVSVLLVVAAVLIAAGVLFDQRRAVESRATVTLSEPRVSADSTPRGA